MKYPRYTREQNLSCKLTEEDISYIRRTYIFRVYTCRMLAKELNVNPYTIFTYISEENHRKKLERTRGERLKNTPRKNSKFLGQYLKKWRIRKINITPVFKDWERERFNTYYQLHKLEYANSYRLRKSLSI